MLLSYIHTYKRELVLVPTQALRHENKWRNANIILFTLAFALNMSGLPGSLTNPFIVAKRAPAPIGKKNYCDARAF
jgi:hypothetical protein